MAGRHAPAMTHRARTPIRAVTPQVFACLMIRRLITCRFMGDVVGMKQQLLLRRIGDDPAARLILALHTTVRRIDAACAELLARYHLSEGRLAALLAIVEDPGIMPRTLADRLDVTTATVTGLLDGLERAGLIERQAHGSDRRALSLLPTSAGRNMVATITPVYAQWLGQLASGLAPETLTDTERALSILQVNLANGTT